MSDKICGKLAELLGANTADIEENSGRYYLSIHHGKDAVVVMKRIVFEKHPIETEENAYNRLVSGSHRVPTPGQIANAILAARKAEILPRM
ncbi:hypothetical protein ACFQ3Y_09105 [Paenibacillus motobuensis]|uniref:hypothetical protein n=1 Tax=Paenibacillus motobuensis TaxID=295324 RepID=UPI003645806E